MPLPHPLWRARALSPLILSPVLLRLQIEISHLEMIIIQGLAILKNPVFEVVVEAAVEAISMVLPAAEAIMMVLPAAVEEAEGDTIMIITTKAHPLTMNLPSRFVPKKYG